ncbi:MAG: outer membrane protein assembly factor BamE [Cyclobacteriaceae bacterium]|nr:outer membrane protein assembly factor BamE [Cyclobacteriaceae bacterium]
MNKWNWMLVVLVFTSCTSSLTIDGFDKEAWTQDRDGCKGKRAEFVDILINNKEILLGKDQKQIKELLGKPDMHEIYRRAQRFYIYSIEPGASCTKYVADKSSANLTLRFNALGRVHEVVYYK